MEKVKVVLVMEGGMSFELEAQEEEPKIETVADDLYEFHRSSIVGPIQFVDVHDNDTPRVVLDHYGQYQDVSDVRRNLYANFRGALGHGLFPRESNHCIQQFTDSIRGFFNGRSPYDRIIGDYNNNVKKSIIGDYNNNVKKSVMIRRLVLRIERRGFWRSPYLARALSHLPEQMGCCPIYGAPRLECVRPVNDDRDLRRLEHESYVVGDGGEDGECLICIEGFERGSEATRLPCRHYFHRRCIAGWVSDSYTCPCCHLDLVPDPDTFPPPPRYRYPDPPLYWLYPPQGISLDLPLSF